jgi:hypothetical protein
MMDLNANVGNLAGRSVNRISAKVFWSQPTFSEADFQTRMSAMERNVIRFRSGHSEH